VKHHVIIVAGGSGTRMGTATPKQFLLVNGLPILMHTIRKFARALDSVNIILVLPTNHHQTWEHLCKEFDFKLPVKLIAGGETRFHSVMNGLTLLNGLTGIVGVHDGVRPLVSEKTIRECFRSAEQYGSAIPVISLNESVRELSTDSSKAIDRSKLRVVQTPQCFLLDTMFKAFEQEYRQSFTDCASVVESAGFEVKLIEGNSENIKITGPSDMLIASALLAEQEN